MAQLSVDLGDATPLELVTVARESQGSGLDSGLEADTRFLNACATAIRARLSVDVSDTGVTVFLKSRLPSSLSPTSGFEYLEAGLHTLSSRVFGANQSLSAVQSVALPVSIDALNGWLSDNGLGGVATIVYAANPTGNNLFFYPKGVADPASKAVYRIDGVVTLTPEEVEEFVDELHMELFVTPDVMSQGVPLWRDSSKFWVERQAELTIQAQLRGAFSRTFPGIRALPEEDTVAGRLDLRLVAMASQGVRRSVGLLELKVVRTFGSTGRRYSANKNSAWIKKGVEQAFAYGQIVESPWATMCCFDMRAVPDRSILGTVAAHAGTLGVRVAHWPIYSHPEGLRDAMVAAALALSENED